MTKCRHLIWTMAAAAGLLLSASESFAQKPDVGDQPGLLADDSVAKVSIVGVGIRSNPGLAAKMFETLAERGINLLAVTASEIKVSALVAESELELAVRVLHTAFGLDEDKAA